MDGASSKVLHQGQKQICHAMISIENECFLIKLPTRSPLLSIDEALSTNNWCDILD